MSDDYCAFIKWAAAWQNQQNNLYTQRRFRAAWASKPSDRSLRCAFWVAKVPMLLHVDSEDSWLEKADAQADPSLCWAQRSFCWFFHAAAQMIHEFFTFADNTIFVFEPNLMKRRFRHCGCVFQSIFSFWVILKWATTWQNQQNECASSEDSDKPGHLPRLIRVFAVHSVGS